MGRSRRGSPWRMLWHLCGAALCDHHRHHCAVSFQPVVGAAGVSLYADLSRAWSHRRRRGPHTGECRAGGGQARCGAFGAQGPDQKRARAAGRPVFRAQRLALFADRPGRAADPGSDPGRPIARDISGGPQSARFTRGTLGRPRRGPSRDDPARRIDAADGHGRRNGAGGSRRPARKLLLASPGERSSGRASTIAPLYRGRPGSRLSRSRARARGHQCDPPNRPATQDRTRLSGEHPTDRARCDQRRQFFDVDQK